MKTKIILVSLLILALAGVLSFTTNYSKAQTAICSELSNNFGATIINYDADNSLTISRDEAVDASVDFFDGLITRDEAIAVTKFFSEGCVLQLATPTPSPSPAPSPTVTPGVSPTPSPTISPTPTPTAQADCMQDAIEKRNGEIIDAWRLSVFLVEGAIETRDDEVQSAWDISDRNERRRVIKRAWSDFRTEKITASRTFRQTRKDVWLEFRNDAKSCGVTATDESVGREINL